MFSLLTVHNCVNAYSKETKEKSGGLIDEACLIACNSFRNNVSVKCNSHLPRRNSTFQVLIAIRKYNFF